MSERSITLSAEEVDRKMREAREKATKDAHETVVALQAEGLRVGIVEETTETITICTTDAYGRERQFGFMKNGGVGDAIRKQIRNPGPMPGEDE